MTNVNEIIDHLILSAVTDEWQKIALMISKIYDDSALTDIPQDKRGQAIADRLYILIDNGGLDCQGNMRRWRDSEVRMVQGRAKP